MFISFRSIITMEQSVSVLRVLATSFLLLSAALVQPAAVPPPSKAAAKQTVVIMLDGFRADYASREEGEI